MLNPIYSDNITLRLLIRIAGLSLILLGLLSTIALRTTAQDESSGPVYVAYVTETIDLGLAPYLDRAISEAEDANAASLIIQINTPGGRLDAVLQMQSALLGADVPTVAFINREAFSAGALVAIASDEIYMAPGSSMGAATPVDGATGESASEKTISAVRSTFRATAEATNRDPTIAEAMVDPAVAIDGLVSDSQLLTLTTSEALEVGYADGTVDTFDALLEELNLTNNEIIEVEQSWAESLVRFLTDPVIASLLFSMGSLLIVVDIFSGEIGPLTGVGVGALATFFWGHFLAGLAGLEGVLLVLLGLALVAVEIFIIPGFGIFGVLGIGSLLGGLYFSLIGRDIVTDGDIERAGLTVASTAVILLIGIVLILIFLPSFTNLRGLVLTSTVGEEDKQAPQAKRRRWFGRGDTEDAEGEPDEPQQPASAGSMVGKRGRALSDLRPGGFAMIDGLRVDVVTEGDYINHGDLIEVIADHGYRRIVKRVEIEDSAGAAGQQRSGSEE